MQWYLYFFYQVVIVRGKKPNTCITWYYLSVYLLQLYVANTSADNGEQVKEQSTATERSQCKYDKDWSKKDFSPPLFF